PSRVSLSDPEDLLAAEKPAPAASAAGGPRRRILAFRPARIASCKGAGGCAHRARPPAALAGLARSLLGASCMEILSLPLAVGFFALTWGFVVLCERLLG